MGVTARKLIIRIVSPYIQLLPDDGIKEYLRKIYEIRGLVIIAKLFDGNTVAIIEKIEPYGATSVDENTEIYLEDAKRKDEKVSDEYLYYIF